MPDSKEPRHIEGYIGDGAYVFMDDFRGIVLYTSNGINETNRVVIDAGDVDRFVSWLDSRTEFLKAHDKNG